MEKQNLHVQKHILHIKKANLHMQKYVQHVGKQNLHMLEYILHMQKINMHMQKWIIYMVCHKNDAGLVFRHVHGAFGLVCSGLAGFECGLRLWFALRPAMI